MLKGYIARESLGTPALQHVDTKSVLRFRKFSLKILFILYHLLILEVRKIVNMVGFQQGVNWNIP